MRLSLGSVGLEDEFTNNTVYKKIIGSWNEMDETDDKIPLLTMEVIII